MTPAKAPPLIEITGVKKTYLMGDTLVRAMKYNPDGSSLYDLPPKDIKQRMRGTNSAGDILFSSASGAVDWISEQPA